MHEGNSARHGFNGAEKLYFLILDQKQTHSLTKSMFNDTHCDRCWIKQIKWTLAAVGGGLVSPSLNRSQCKCSTNMDRSKHTLLALKTNKNKRKRDCNCAPSPSLQYGLSPNGSLAYFLFPISLRRLLLDWNIRKKNVFFSFSFSPQWILLSLFQAPLTAEVYAMDLCFVLSSNPEVLEIPSMQNVTEDDPENR